MRKKFLKLVCALGTAAALALGITNLVKAGHIDLMKLIELMSLNPAKFYGFDAGRLYVGGVADIAIFDPNEEWTVEDFRSKSSNSPFIGSKLTGKVRYTIASGKTVYK